MIFLVDIPDPAQAIGWLETIRNYPIMISLLLVGLVCGALLMYAAIRRGYVSTPAMKEQMDALHKENEELRITLGGMKMEMELMRENDRKYQALVDSVMAAYEINKPKEKGE